MLHVVVPVMIAGAMPFLLTLISKAGGFTPEDNRRTRQWQAQLTGWRQRAYWAHQNAFESFPLFAAAAILAHLGAPGSALAVGAAWAYPALRVAYSACFLADLGRLRSLVWLVSMGCIATLFVAALR